MKEVKIKSWHEMNYPDDVKRIKRVLEEHDYSATNSQCVELWRMYSGSMCAGWLFLPDSDDEIFECIASYLEDE
jgi:cephalosporin-C deacetylase-like acetyl esterase